MAPLFPLLTGNRPFPPPVGRAFTFPPKTLVVPRQLSPLIRSYPLALFHPKKLIRSRPPPRVTGAIQSELDGAIVIFRNYNVILKTRIQTNPPHWLASVVLYIILSTIGPPVDLPSVQRNAWHDLISHTIGPTGSAGNHLDSVTASNYTFFFIILFN